MNCHSSAPPKSLFVRIFTSLAGWERFGIGLLRLGLVIVLFWICGLKIVSYEADVIVPLVANSPLASLMYQHPAPEYRQHMDKEGAVKPANQDWQRSNNTYAVSYGLGVIIVTLGLLITSLSRPAASLDNRQRPSCPHVPDNAFVFRYDA